jgi:hypothetical protein
VATLLALSAVAACDPVAVVNDGVISSCATIDADAYEAGSARASHFNGTIDASGVWSSTAAGASRRRCFPTSGGMTPGLTDRHCVQRNDLFVQLTDSAGVRHYEVPAMTTYKLYASDGVAICEIVEEAE